MTALRENAPLVTAVGGPKGGEKSMEEHERIVVMVVMVAVLGGE